MSDADECRETKGGGKEAAEGGGGRVLRDCEAGTEEDEACCEDVEQRADVPELWEMSAPASLGMHLAYA